MLPGARLARQVPLFGGRRAGRPWVGQPTNPGVFHNVVLVWYGEVRSGQESSVDGEVCAGDVGGVIGEQERDRGGDLCGRCRSGPAGSPGRRPLRWLRAHPGKLPAVSARQLKNSESKNKQAVGLKKRRRPTEDRIGWDARLRPTARERIGCDYARNFVYPAVRFGSGRAHCGTASPNSRLCFATAGGPPKVLRIDNGPELVSAAPQQFRDGEAGMSYIPPGCPWVNGHIESFNNRLRKGCLDRNHWSTLLEARVVIGDFKHEHNHRHRHSALGYRTPCWCAWRGWCAG